MPKKSRQAHIPSQVRRRKPRRPDEPTNGHAATPRDPASTFEPNFAEQPLSEIPALGARGPVDTTPRPRVGGRRFETLTQSRERATAVRVIPGQLPTFERSYLVNELQRIGIISGALLALIIVLAVVLR